MAARRKEKTYKTRKEVQEQLKRAQHDQLQGTLVTTPQQKVEQFLTHWLENTHRQSIRLRTYERYEEIVRLHLIREGARGHRLEALFLLALGTGMRRAEVMGLKWQDLDFTQGTLQVRRILTRVPTRTRGGQGPAYVETEPKTERGRRCLFLPPFALEALKRHRGRQLEEKLKAGLVWQDHDYVFCTSVGTHLNPTRDILDQLKKLLEKAGLPAIRFHDLRHSAATALLALGTNPKIVQEVLGHSAISITMDVYSHVLPTMQKEAMNRLNDALQGYGRVLLSTLLSAGQRSALR
jgi:integrase